MNKLSGVQEAIKEVIHAGYPKAHWNALENRTVLGENIDAYFLDLNR